MILFNKEIKGKQTKNKVQGNRLINQTENSNQNKEFSDIKFEVSNTLEKNQKMSQKLEDTEFKL